jgi:ankyrin repeat protein
VDALINAGSDPNLSSRKGVTPISAAAHKGNIIIMEKLIIAGAAVNAVNQSGSTALIQVFLFIPSTNLAVSVGFSTGCSFWSFKCSEIASKIQCLT